jgi:molybdopterin biosynthesis enzyme MoaB
LRHAEGRGFLPCAENRRHKTERPDRLRTEGFRVFIIPPSDRASAGMNEDRSGPRVKEMLKSYFSEKEQRFEIHT